VARATAADAPTVAGANIAGPATSTAQLTVPRVDVGSALGQSHEGRRTSRKLR